MTICLVATAACFYISSLISINGGPLWLQVGIIVIGTITASIAASIEAKYRENLMLINNVIKAAGEAFNGIKDILKKGLEKIEKEKE